MTQGTGAPGHRDWLAEECRWLLDFGLASPHPLGGSAWLDEKGSPDTTGPVHTWITARMLHVHGLGVMLAAHDAAPVADAMLAGLRGPLRDARHGGWFTAVDVEGRPLDDGLKACYAHAFVVLGAATAALAGRPGAEDLLADALAVFQNRFWDEDAGMCVDAWDRSWSAADPYRGLNGTMHGVEAMLAAADAGADPVWRERAARVCERVADLGRDHGWRLPEHFDEAWTPLLEFHREVPDDPFKPYGATVGHAFEWARLLLHLEAALDGATSMWSTPAAVALFDRAVADGWASDGAPGFVYTTDWDGRPVVRQRMHWVAAEAVAAAAALHRRTGEAAYAALASEWWAYVDAVLIDRELGSWHHELDPRNRPASTVWRGKPDLYHAVQATLLPRLPLAPTIARAVRDRLLDQE